MESWTMQNRLKYLWVREKKKKQRSKIINFYYCKSLCYLTAGNSKHNIQTPKARRGVELGEKKTMGMLNYFETTFNHKQRRRRESLCKEKG